VLALLWSINEQMAGREGYEIDPPAEDWIDDLLWLNDLDVQKDREEKTGEPEEEY
jgi:hypothetical protein